MDAQQLLRDVIQAAADLNGRRLWKRFTDRHCFAVRIPEQGVAMLATVLGSGGAEFGLTLFRGGQAAAALEAILDPGGAGDDVMEEMDTLGFSLDPFGELPPEEQELFRAAGLHPRYEERVPTFLVKPPGRHPHIADEADLRLLLTVLRGALDADRRKTLAPTRLDDPEGVCTLTLTGDPAAPQVAVTREPWRSAAAPAPATIPLVTADLSGLPRLDAKWLVGLPSVPINVGEDDRSVQVLLVLDDASERMLLASAFPAGELAQAADALVQAFRTGGAAGPKGLPRGMVFSSLKLQAAMDPVLKRAGVESLYVPTIPKLQDAVEHLFDFLGRAGPPLAEDDDDALDAPAARASAARVPATRAPAARAPAASNAPSDAVPAADDLAGWKAADSRVARRFAAALGSEKGLSSPRAVKRYFGENDLTRYFKAHEQRGVIHAFASWAIVDYRSSRTSKTRAEKMLAEGLPEAEARLVRARLDAHPTLYRVAGHNAKAGTIDLEDVLLGGSVTVHDQMMSENIENNALVAARAFAAGQFHFFDPAGPPLGAEMGLEAVNFLEGCGLKFTPDDLRRDAHIFGWLWDWADEWEADWQPPHICNTDGDDMLWHTVSFGVADAAAVRAALRQRPDIDCEEESGEFLWVKRTGRGAKMLGGPVNLGRIEFIGDELVLTVNSVERYNKACRWLEKIPGVTFRGVTTRGMDEPEEDRPMDERMPRTPDEELPPDAAAAMQEMLDKTYMGWLDEPIPMLGGKSPRRACKTAEGRRQVTMLIRMMPDPMGPAPIRVPRQAMLHALGLEEEAAAASAPPRSDSPGPAPAEPASSAAVADLGLPPFWDDLDADPARGGDGYLCDSTASHPPGRNDPCPCGSGKKFKKCCGSKS